MKKSNFIIVFLSTILLLIGFTSIAQIDSTGIQNLIGTGLGIVTTINGEGNLIPSVPNAITGSLITLIAGVLIRLFEKRKLRRKGHLIDKKLKDSVYPEQ